MANCFLVFIPNTPLIVVSSFGQTYPLYAGVGGKDEKLKSFFYYKRENQNSHRKLAVKSLRS
jgi:hypothetical protein